MGNLTRYDIDWDLIEEKSGRCSHWEENKEYKFCPECGEAWGRVNHSALIERFLTDNEGIYYPLLSDGERFKWYDYADDMLKLSSRFPGVLFILDGEGEENGDIWKAYFLDGKWYYQDAVIVHPPFDEEKLK